MAALTITIVNGIGVFGIAPSTRWGEFNWGEAFWGDGTFDVITNLTKYISNSLALDSTIFKNTSKFISNSITIETDMADQYWLTGNSYYYLFTRPTIDGNDRVVTDWTEL